MLGRKVIYVRCIHCSYNNVAKGISHRVKKKAIFAYTGKKFMQLRAFERYISFGLKINNMKKSLLTEKQTTFVNKKGMNTRNLVIKFKNNM